MIPATFNSSLKCNAEAELRQRGVAATKAEPLLKDLDALLQLCYDIRVNATPGSHAKEFKALATRLRQAGLATYVNSASNYYGVDHLGRRPTYVCTVSRQVGYLTRASRHHDKVHLVKFHVNGYPLSATPKFFSVHHVPKDKLTFPLPEDPRLRNLVFISRLSGQAGYYYTELGQPWFETATGRVDVSKHFAQDFVDVHDLASLPAGALQDLCLKALAVANQPKWLKALLSKALDTTVKADVTGWLAVVRSRLSCLRAAR